VFSVMTTKERPWYQVGGRFLPSIRRRSRHLAHIDAFTSAWILHAHINYDLTLNKDKVTAHINVSEGKRSELLRLTKSREQISSTTRIG